MHFVLADLPQMISHVHYAAQLSRTRPTTPLDRKLSALLEADAERLFGLLQLYGAKNVSYDDMPVRQARVPRAGARRDSDGSELGSLVAPALRAAAPYAPEPFEPDMSSGVLPSPASMASASSSGAPRRKAAPNALDAPLHVLLKGGAPWVLAVNLT